MINHLIAIIYNDFALCTSVSYVFVALWTETNPLIHMHKYQFQSTYWPSPLLSLPSPPYLPSFLLKVAWHPWEQERLLPLGSQQWGGVGPGQEALVPEGLKVQGEVVSSGGVEAPILQYWVLSPVKNEALKSGNFMEPHTDTRTWDRLKIKSQSQGIIHIYNPSQLFLNTQSISDYYHTAGKSCLIAFVYMKEGKPI